MRRMIMTVNEVLQRVGELRPGHGRSADYLIGRLRELEMKVFDEVINTHENTEGKVFCNFESIADGGVTLAVGAPHDRIYADWLLYYIDRDNLESARETATAARFAADWQDFADSYNRSHMPLQRSKLNYMA